MSNPKLEALNSKQTRSYKDQNLKQFGIYSLLFGTYLGFSNSSLDLGVQK